VARRGAIRRMPDRGLKSLYSAISRLENRRVVVGSKPRPYTPTSTHGKHDEEVMFICAPSSLIRRTKRWRLERCWWKAI
jgi:hypothetical protein